MCLGQCQQAQKRPHCLVDFLWFGQRRLLYIGPFLRHCFGLGQFYGWYHRILAQQVDQLQLCLIHGDIPQPSVELEHMTALTTAVTAPDIFPNIQVQFAFPLLTEGAVHINAVGQLPADRQPQDCGNIQYGKRVLAQTAHLLPSGKRRLSRWRVLFIRHSSA